MDGRMFVHQPVESRCALSAQLHGILSRHTLLSGKDTDFPEAFFRRQKPIERHRTDSMTIRWGKRRNIARHSSKNRSAISLPPMPKLSHLSARFLPVQNAQCLSKRPSLKKQQPAPGKKYRKQAAVYSLRTISYFNTAFIV